MADREGDLEERILCIPARHGRSPRLILSGSRPTMPAPPDPIGVFRRWRALAAEAGNLSQPDAVCLSTVDENGNPDARFVDLKAVRGDGFVFGTSFRSPKSSHIAANRHVALTFWWDHVGRQVRVLGEASRLGDAEADDLFRARSRDAQLVTWAFAQSAAWPPDRGRDQILGEMQRRFGSGAIPRPPHWGGYVVAPRRIEFLAFDVARVHQRVLYERIDGAWTASELQP